MSRFLDGISTIISFFYKYAKEDGDCSKLSRRKMQEFIQREFADVIAKPRDPQTIDKILQFLEWDGDGHIDFNEFLLLVFRVAKACYWLQPKGPYLLQRTKLTSRGKLPQEPEIKNTGSSRQLQEEEEQTCESNHHPPCKPELQRDTRVNKLEILEETGSYQQRNTESVNDAKRSNERREPIPQVLEERSREPCDQWNSQRRRQPPEPNRRGDVQVRKHRNLEAHEHRLRRDERKYPERPQQDQLAHMRSRSQTCETRPLQNRWGSRQPHEPVGPANDDRNQRPQEADRGSDNQPHKPELLTEERGRYLLQELEQRALEESSHKQHEPECLDSRGPYQSYIKEPLEIDLRYCNTCELERRIDEQVKNEEHNLEYVETESENHKTKEREERDDARRKDRMQDRRVDMHQELDFEVYERRSHHTRDREQRGPSTHQRERREILDLEARETEIDGRRKHDLVSIERTRETDVLAAEADVKIHRVSRELEPRNELRKRERELECLEKEEERRIYLEREIEDPVKERRVEHKRELDLDIIERRCRQTRDREEQEPSTHQEERREILDLEAREAEIDGRRKRDLVSIERTQEKDVLAAEADVKIHRVSRELEPRNELRRRERELQCLEAEEERRIFLEREREGPLRERRVERQRELDLDIIERRRRQTRDREQQGHSTHQRERREILDLEAREAEIDGRRKRDLVSIEKTRETDLLAAEADVKIHRVSRELEPRNELRRRERELECLDAEEERRIFLEREIEDPVRERRVKRQRELDLDIIERRRRQTRDREEQGHSTHQEERREILDLEAREAEIDGRRKRDLVSIERARETDLLAAEAEVKIHRVSRELEPRNELRRRERELQCLEAEEERRIFLEREREGPLRERKVERQRELDLDIIERHSRQTRDREQRGAMTHQEERREILDLEAREAENDGRRKRDLVSIERTQETDLLAAEADVKVHCVSRELEPRNELRRRERELECLEEEEERRIFLEREREGPLRERRVERQRELDLDIIERRRRQTRDREQRGAMTHQEERREILDLEAREAEIDGRRKRDLVSIERARETDLLAAEADVKIHCVSRELEPRNELRRRERELQCLEAEEERRIFLEREIEEPLRERRVEHQQELDMDIIERRRRQTHDREQRGAMTHQEERREILDLEAREAENDGRRKRDLVSIERTQETDLLAAEADVKVHCVSRELEPRNELRRRERELECLEEEEERRIFLEREREGPLRERRVERQRELDLDIIERRRRQTRDREQRGAMTHQEERREILDLEAREAEIDGRRKRDLVSIERARETDLLAAEADVKIHCVSRELEPRNELRRRERELQCLEAEEERRIFLEREIEEPLRERRVEHQQELDMDIIERRRRQTHDREQRGAMTHQEERREILDLEAREAEIDGRRKRDLVSIERTRETDLLAAEADVKIHRVSRELEPRNELRRRERELQCLEAEEERRIFLEREREGPLRERKVERQRELDLDIIERHSRQTRDREQQGAMTHQEERREILDLEAREAEIDGRRKRDLVSIERTRETDLLAAEADVKIHRVSRELEPRNELRRRERELECLEEEEERRIFLEREREGPLRERRVERQRELDLDIIERRRRQTRDREQRGAMTHQEERREILDLEAREAEIDGRRKRDLVSIERARETDVLAAEADVKVHRVSRELEPRNELRRRERELECLEAEEERRIFLEREREGPLRERRVERQRELDLDIIERRRRQTRDREQRGPNTHQRERREILDLEAREAEIDGRRKRDLVSIERARETDLLAAEADVKIHRVSRELEPRNELRRRERELQCLEAEEERRIFLEREIEEPLRERRVEHQRELDLDIIERRRRQTHDREQRGAMTHQEERREILDLEAREAEIDGRRKSDLVSIERTRETDLLAAEADVKIHRVSRELEPRNELRRRERELQCLEAEEERRIFLEREREGPLRERKVERQRELDLDIIERHSRQTRDREQQGHSTHQKERREILDLEAREAEIDGRRKRDLVSIERTRETDLLAAEADVKVHRVSRELEPRNELRRRERELECLEAEEERRIFLEREIEDPVRERRVEHQRELDLDIIEHRRRQTRDREQQGHSTHQRERREILDLEAREAEIDGRRKRDLVSIERARETDVLAAEADVKIHRVSRELEPRNELRRRERELQCLEEEEERRIFLEREREGPLRERRVERQRELDLDIIERHSRQTRDREPRGAMTHQEERREILALEARAAEIDRRRKRDLVSIERARETDVLAAEADVKVHRVSRELEPRNELRRRERELECLDAEEERRIFLEREIEEPQRERRVERQLELDLDIMERRRRQTRDREQQGHSTHQRETREILALEAREAEIDRRRKRDLVSIERTRETDLLAAEADVKIHRVSRELEPRNELRRRERELQCLEAEEERRIFLEREREGPLRERRVERQRELDLDIIERHSRQKRDREPRGAMTHQIERREILDLEAREPEIDRRRKRDLVSIERTRETDVLAAEADVKIHRVSRELEPRNELRRRERELQCLEAEEERRIFLERETEEPVRERRVERQRELDLDIIERRRHQTRDREQQGAMIHQEERREILDLEARKAEIDGRRKRDLVSIERTRETDLLAAEADVKVHRVSRELEPRNELRRRERELQCLEAEEERRIFLEREIEEPLRERRVEHQRELDLDIIERRRRQTRDREEQGHSTHQRERREILDLEAREAEIDGRRKRGLVSIERARETDLLAAEADVKIHRVSRELEPRNELRRRERELECLQEEEERRIFLEREVEEPLRERRVEHQWELDLDIIERRRRQTRDREQRGAMTHQRERHEILDLEARVAEIDGRRKRDLVSTERTQESDLLAAEAEVKIHRVSRELEPRNELRRRERELQCLEAEEERRIFLEREREGPLRERRVERQRELDLDIIECRRRQTRDREQRGPNTHQRESREILDLEAREAEIDGRRKRGLLSIERARETDLLAAEADVKIHRVSRELEPRNELRRRERELECLEAEEERRIFLEREREGPLRERRVERQRELDLDIIERHSCQTRDREQRGAMTHQIERREILDLEAREAEIDRRRKRDLVSIERTQETDLLAAEADVKIHRMSRELEPRNELRRRERELQCLEAEEERRIFLEREREGPLRERRVERQRELDMDIIERRRRQTRDREQRGAMTHQRERREILDLEAREAEIDRRRKRDLVSIERTRETDLLAAEADVKIHRVSRELEPRNELRRRERELECLEAEEERRIFLEREIEEPLRERKVEHQRELDLDIIERHSRQTRDREEQGPSTHQRERREILDLEAREAEIDGMRKRDLVSIERARETDLLAAEADVKIHRVSRELEPRNELRRRERELECLQEEEERRIFLEREVEEPLRERRVEHQRELDLDIIERRRRQTRDREQRGAMTHQEERREILDLEARKAEIDGRRKRDLVSIERARETDLLAAEADVKIHRVSRELEPRNELRRRERELQCLEAEEERRIFLEREREGPLREKGVERQRELDLDIIERRRRQTRDREQQGHSTHQRERREILDLEAHEAEIDRRRKRDLVSIERARETDVLAAEADVKIHRVSRELEPRNELRRRERELECLDAEEERRIFLERETGEPVRERRVERQRELDLEIIERHSRQTRDREERGAKTSKQTHERNLYQEKKGYVSSQPLVVPSERSNNQEPRPQRGELEIGVRELPSCSQENRGDLKEPQVRSEIGVKEGPYQTSASELSGVKGDPCHTKSSENRRDSQWPKRPAAEEKKHQLQGYGSKTTRQQVPLEPESSCQLREREDREAKSCPPLPQALELREAYKQVRQGTEGSRSYASRQDEARRCWEDAKSRQPRQENIKRRCQEVSDGQPQREGEPCQ